MGGTRKRYKGLVGIDFSEMSTEELEQAFSKILKNKIYGLAFSPYKDFQKPGSILSEKQIYERMEIIQPYVEAVRTFSCTDGNQYIPRIAHEKGIDTLVGAWLGKDEEKNEKEIEGLIKVAQDGHADMLGVGNEVLLRGDLSKEKTIEYIERVKKAVPNIPVGYVDAYYIFEQYPRVTELCDIIFANCYPFWEGYSIEHSFLYMKEMYHLAKRVGKGKEVIISETGWPNLGTPDRSAVPSYENALKYFINAYTWAGEEDVDIFYFSSFDEEWKIDAEGDVGAFWGLWDKDGNLKYGSLKKN